MAFTASALSFMFDNLDKPIIVTGSQIPLEALRSDGQTNLLNALYLAANYSINEVTLFFNNKLFRGNRTVKSHADGFDAFTSPNCPPLIDAGIHIRCLQSCPLPKNDGNFSSHKITPQPIWGCYYLSWDFSTKYRKHLIATHQSTHSPFLRCW